MEIKEGIRSFAEQIILWQTQTLWAPASPREQNSAVLLNKTTRAGYKGDLRVGSHPSHSTGAVPQRQPS